MPLSQLLKKNEGRKGQKGQKGQKGGKNVAVNENDSIVIEDRSQDTMNSIKIGTDDKEGNLDDGVIICDADETNERPVKIQMR